MNHLYSRKAKGLIVLTIEVFVCSYRRINDGVCSVFVLDSSKKKHQPTAAWRILDFMIEQR
jgi:hypothetical protein